jgi:hypothetical protein
MPGALSVDGGRPCQVLLVYSEYLHAQCPPAVIDLFSDGGLELRKVSREQRGSGRRHHLERIAG